MTVVIICKHALLLTVLYTVFISVSSDVSEETSVENNREENTIDETIVEFKTQSPPDHQGEPKNCYEFLYGKLNAIRKHGATWQNGVADCSNCTCDNGDIRCFFHFCNGPSMGYMTPPTTEEDLILSTPFVEEEITEDLVSSGQRPREADEEDEVTEEETTLPVNLKSGEGSKFEAEESLSDGGADGEEKDRTENETYHFYKAFFCDKTCKKSCPQGFKVDRVAGCWKCQCNKCLTHLTCETKCPFGYAVDFNGCETCTCSMPSESNNEDIVFTDDYNEVLRHLNNDIDNTLTLDNDYMFDQSPPDEDQERSNSSFISHDDSESNSSSSSEEYDDEKDDEEYESYEREDDEEDEDEHNGKEIVSTEESNEEEVEKAKGEEDEEKENEEKQMDEGYEEEEEKRMTLPPGKLSTFPKGRRMPHVVRLTPENIELTSYPSIRKEKDNKDEPCDNTQDIPVPVFIERPHESRSTSRVPTELLPLKYPSNYMKDEAHKKNEETMITSIPKDERSHLLSILVPMGIIGCICASLFVVLWRKYHSDKYDINSYRPEEKQKLRPVKTLSDDNSLIGHVC